MTNTKKKYKNNINKKTIKQKVIFVPSTTPLEIIKISNNIAGNIETNSSSSYSPTINEDLVPLLTIPRNDLINCNIENAFKLQTPLKIGIPFKNNCFLYSSKEAKNFLLNNLSANKHINPYEIITPIQSQSNCWFNTFFVTLFVSDKGRKFFHFFRQLMIQGIQKDGKKIKPNKLKDAFALLNYAIECCLTGNKYAYILNTNNIINLIFKSIPKIYKDKMPYIVNVSKAGNPIYYYMSILHYLNNNSLNILLIKDTSLHWKEKVNEILKYNENIPHIIIFEIYEQNASIFNKKPLSFSLNNEKYSIDSAVIRDTTGQHFCATITCEKKEFGYDGMSFHRLVPLEWKDFLNNNKSWEFEGTKDLNGKSLEWNFSKCYQLLLYYRI